MDTFDIELIQEKLKEAVELISNDLQKREVDNMLKGEKNSELSKEEIIIKQAMNEISAVYCKLNELHKELSEATETK